MVDDFFTSQASAASQAAIFAVFPGTIPRYDAMESLLSSQYAWRLVDKIEVLAKYRQEEGVVLMGLGNDASRAEHFMGMVRSLAPLLVPVLAVTAEQAATLPTSLMKSCDVIVVDHASDWEIQARIARAADLSAKKQLLEETAQRDDVTELFNQSFFMKRLGEELSLARRHQSPVSVAIVDITFYRVYLDSYGYGFVTDMIKAVAGEVAQAIRKEDMVARIGDSEVAIMLPRSPEQGAAVLATRLAKKLATMSVAQNDQSEKLEVSVGVATYPASDPNDTDPNSLVRYARHALHHAKTSESEDKKIVCFSELKPVL